MITSRVSAPVLPVILLVVAICYIAVTIAFAVFLLNRAFFHTFGDFEKAAVGALIVVIGTGLTAFAALYAAIRQAAAAHEIEVFRKESSAELAKLTTRLNTDLERLKASLDAAKTAHRELFGAASTYFYALRSGALGLWDAELLKKSEAGMVDACRHVIYADDEMKDEWFRFWQEAQRIYREALTEPDAEKRMSRLSDNIIEPVGEGSSQFNLREQHNRIERTAKLAMTKSA